MGGFWGSLFFFFFLIHPPPPDPGCWVWAWAWWGEDGIYMLNGRMDIDSLLFVDIFIADIILIAVGYAAFFFFPLFFVYS